MHTLREDALTIIHTTIRAVLPGEAVRTALHGRPFGQKVYLVAIGKAAFAMAAAAKETLGERITDGVVITKYGHAQGELNGIRIYEAGHPVPDERTLTATQAALDMTAGLNAGDEVLFLVSGGGSALFEKPADGVTLEDIQHVTDALLRCGADITEINTLRKRLSQVKGGKFLTHCAPARMFCVILSDVLGDAPDSIASGPAYPDASTAEDVQTVIQKYKLDFPLPVIKQLSVDTPKGLTSPEIVIAGGAGVLCAEAAKAAAALGYAPFVLTASLNGEAREAGRFFGETARAIRRGCGYKTPCAVIAGGETVVTVKGTGKGGRNQELALSAAAVIEGLADTVIFSVGSDGTDGPTDAAGGMVDGDTKRILTDKGVDISDVLRRNDSYHALEQADALIITGPTGTNVNDLTVLLCR